MLNLISFSNAKNIINTRNKNPEKNTGFQNNALNYKNFNIHNINTNKLKPLAQDTISFGNILNTALLEAIDNKDICEKLHKNAKKASEDLDKTLKTYLKDLTEASDGLSIVSSIDKRIKTTDSIREKATEIFEAQMFLKHVTEYFSIYNVESIKKRLHDIVGARITLEDAQDYKGDIVLDKIIQAVKDGKLKIIRIENYVSNDMPINMEYFSREKLAELKEAVNSMQDSNEEPVGIEQKSKKTGYMALHLDVDLSDGDKYPSNMDKYFGEIQIVGKDVAKLKEVEDLCYKLKSGKAIKNNSANYTPFTNYFMSHYKVERNRKLEKYFDEYTSRAFLIQRQKSPDDPRSDQLPTIEECGLKGKVPSALDFNILRRLKEDCDDIAKIQENPQKFLDEIVKKRNKSADLNLRPLNILNANQQKVSQ